MPVPRTGYDRSPILGCLQKLGVEILNSCPGVVLREQSRWWGAQRLRGEGLWVGPSQSPEEALG